MEYLIFLVLVIILVIYLVCFQISNFSNCHSEHTSPQGSHSSEEPCRTYLTNREYLLHMIPHHQVAVDISIILQKTTKSPAMQTILRQLIWTQRYEIKMMEEMLKTLPQDISSQEKMQKNYISTISDFIPPNQLGLTQTYCDPHFFDPQSHMKHMEGMKIDDQMYLEHMIPHHQVAVDMSKKLIQNSHSDFMIYLAYRIIRSQQEEIILLQDLMHENNFRYQSQLM